MKWRGKQAALVGIARSNMAVARFLAAQGANITACDKKSADQLGAYYEELLKLGAQFQLGTNYLRDLSRFDIIFVSPGVPKYLPELMAAQEAGVELSSEINLFFDLCRAHIIGVTGTSGKTTTSTIISEILSTAGFNTVLGGNMGRPLLEQATKLPCDAWVVLELSSFQLQLLHKSPEIAVITNLAPDHLNVHESMLEYVDAKANIFRYQSPTDWVVFNADDEYTCRHLVDAVKGKLAWFCSRNLVGTGAGVLGGGIVLGRNGNYTEVCSTSEIRLMGRHNLENILAAVAVADLVGCSPGASRDVISSFTGVAHRLELVCEAQGIAYYNDSTATSPVEAAAGLRSFNRPVVLIAGGQDKSLPWKPLVEAVAERAKAVVLFGEASTKIAAALYGNVPAKMLVRKVANLEAAVKMARRLASAGDVVLLSPACASFDMFANFEERGQIFREIVVNLTEAGTPARSQ